MMPKEEILVAYKSDFCIRIKKKKGLFYNTTKWLVMDVTIKLYIFKNIIDSE